jgi:hypothetical protein
VAEAEINRLLQIIVDHTVAWQGVIERRGGVPYESITVKKYGEMRIYWGTLDQPVQDMFTAHFNATTADETFDAQPARTDHLPPWRGVALLVMQQFFMGQGRTQMPTVEVVVERAPLWFSDRAAPLVDTRGSNAIALLYEWLVDDWFGVGLDPARLDHDEWVAAFAAAEEAGHHLSPLITDMTGFRQVVASMLEYFDGWIRRGGTQLSVGFWRHGATDTGGLPSINDTVMTAEPALKSTGYGDTINQVNVAFRDRAKYWDDASQPANATGNLRIVGERRPESVSRPWIIDSAHAAAYATEYLNLRSQPSYTGPVKLKREFAESQGILPGSLIKLDSGTYGLEIVCRVTEISYPADKDGGCELTLENERGLFPTIYYPVPPARVPDFLVIAARIVHARVLALPSGLKDSAAVEVAFLEHFWKSRSRLLFSKLLGRKVL